MMAVDPEVAAAIRSGAVPSHIKISLLMEKRDEPAKIALLAVGILTIIIVALRFTSRWSVNRLGIDDVFAGLSLILQIAFIVLSVFLINLGTGRHLQYIRYVMPPDHVVKSQVLDYVAHLIYTTALFLCRISGLAFYRRLCELHRRLSLAIKCALGLLIAAYIPQMFFIIFHCDPVTALWPYSWQVDRSQYVCRTWGLVYTVNSGLSLVCDVLMFVIPVALIHTLALPLRRKFHLYMVLLPGVLVIIISVARINLVVKGQWRPDSSWNYNPMVAIENAEMGGTLIALSIPGLKPLADRFFHKVGLHRSQPPSFNALNPSDVFASDLSKTTVAVEERALQPITNTWAGLGVVHYGGVPYDMTTSTDNDEAGHRGTLPPNPWGQSFGGLTHSGMPKS